MPTATTSQRMSERDRRVGRSRLHGSLCARPPQVLDAADEVSTTATHSSDFHSQVASTAVIGMIAKPTASCWTSVLCLPILLAGTLTPRAPAKIR